MNEFSFIKNPPVHSDKYNFFWMLNNNVATNIAASPAVTDDWTYILTKNQ